VAYKAEYIWIDGTEPSANTKLRSKTKILADGAELPIWGFDGSSTNQAPGSASDCVLQPVFSCPDPVRGGNDVLVLCEVLLTDMTPHRTNTRAALREVAAKYASQEPWFGIEQEYTFFEGSRPLGFPPKGFPAPQGGYYCGVGSDEIFGRPIVEKHMQACLDAGLLFSGINAEVMPGQWEFQIGPGGPLDVSDHLWIARWLLYRIAEEWNISATLDPKPVHGDWNGAGAHTNFSTKARRTSYDPIIAACEALGDNFTDHVHEYGPVERVQLRRVEPGRVGAHPLAGRGGQERLHRGPPPQRQLRPLPGHQGDHRDVLLGPGGQVHDVSRSGQEAPRRDASSRYSGTRRLGATNLRSIPHHQEDADVLSRQPELDGQSTKALVEGPKPPVSNNFGRACNPRSAGGAAVWILARSRDHRRVR
jgi:glutamine synthetase